MIGFAKKYFNLTTIGTIASIIGVIIAIIILSKEQVNAISSFVLFPFPDSITPDINSPISLHWFVTLIVVVFYIFMGSLIFKGVKFISTKNNSLESRKLLCGNEIAAMLDAIDSDKSATEVNERIFSFMNEFDKNVASIFELEQNALKSFWVFEISENTTVNTTKKYILIDINHVSRPTNEDKEIVDWALNQKNPNFYDDRIKRNFNGCNEEVVFIRNYGKLSLGYIVLFEEKNSITNDRLEQLEFASSYLMLLGRIDILIEKMVKYIKDKEGII